MTVCGVTVCPFSRHKGIQRPKCLKNKAHVHLSRNCPFSNKTNLHLEQSAKGRVRVKIANSQVWELPNLLCFCELHDITRLRPLPLSNYVLFPLPAVKFWQMVNLGLHFPFAGPGKPPPKWAREIGTICPFGVFPLFYSNFGPNFRDKKSMAMAMFKRKFARTIPDNLRAPHIKMWGFEAKRARKFTRTSPRTLPFFFHYHAFFFPDKLRPIHVARSNVVL